MTSHSDTPAFPTPPAIINGLDVALPEQGMTLRDYFAAKAMQAIISLGLDYSEYEEYSLQAYAVADAMMKARNGQT